MAVPDRLTTFLGTALARGAHLAAAAVARVRRSLAAPAIPARWLSTQAYVNRFGARYYPVYPPTTPRRKPPRQFGAGSVDMGELLDQEIPGLGVLELKQARIVGHHGWIVAREGILLPEQSWYGEHVGEMRVRPEVSRWRTIRLRGVCLTLASDWASINYGHFLLDSLPRHGLFLKAGLAVSDVDHVYCPRPPFPHAQRLLGELGIPAEKIVPADRIVVRPDVLLAPSFPGVRRSYPAWVPEFLRETFVEARVVPHRRLYISRAGYRRKVINEDRLLPHLLRHGFEVRSADNLEAADFAEAAVVVGAHGAGLAGLAFCAPGITKVLELIPSDHPFPYHYYTLSAAAGFWYGYIVGPSVKHRPPGARRPSPYDFSIDEAEFRAALEAICG